MKLVFWTLAGLAAALLALFAASNREPVALALWPLGVAVELPLYLAILGAFLVGFIVGALFLWSAGWRRRREARAHRRRLAALELELAATQAQLPGADAAAPMPLAARG